MTTAIYGTVRSIKPYQSSGNCVIEIEIPVEYFVRAAPFYDQSVLVTSAKLPIPFGVHEQGAAMGVEPNEVQTAPGKERPFLPSLDAVDKARSKAKFPGGMCGLAVRWCQDVHFCDWLEATFPETWAQYPAPNGKDTARDVVCDICQIDSRKLLDEDAAAEEIFRREILVPYAEQRKADGLDG